MRGHRVIAQQFFRPEDQPTPSEPLACFLAEVVAAAAAATAAQFVRLVQVFAAGEQAVAPILA